MASVVSDSQSGQPISHVAATQPQSHSQTLSSCCCHTAPVSFPNPFPMLLPHGPSLIPRPFPHVAATQPESHSQTLSPCCCHTVPVSFPDPFPMLLPHSSSLIPRPFPLGLETRCYPQLLRLVKHASSRTTALNWKKRLQSLQLRSSLCIHVAWDGTVPT